MQHELLGINANFRYILSNYPQDPLTSIINRTATAPYARYMLEFRRVADVLDLKKLMGFGSRITQIVVDYYKETLTPHQTKIVMKVAIEANPFAPEIEDMPPDIILEFTMVAGDESYDVIRGLLHTHDTYVAPLVPEPYTSIYKDHSVIIDDIYTAHKRLSYATLDFQREVMHLGHHYERTRMHFGHLDNLALVLDIYNRMESFNPE